MTSALFVSHTAEKSGAELFLFDLLKDAEPSWGSCFLSRGAIVDELTAIGRPPIVLQAGGKMLAIRRNASPRALVAGVSDVLKAARKLAQVAKNFDVICANSQKSLFVCAIAAQLANKPVIWFLHDIVTDVAYSKVNRAASMFFSRHFTKLVAVNSVESKNAFLNAGGALSKVRIVYNGFNPSESQLHTVEKGEALRSELNFDDRPIVGLFGRLSEWKGQHIFIEGIARCENVQAIIVGAPLFGEVEYEARLKERVAELGISERVMFLGFRNDVKELMAAVDLVAHTSIANEPFGRVVVEGMLSERPVIATRGGGVSEIISHEQNGLLVEAGSPESLAMAITRIINNPDLAEALAKEGRLTAMQRFSIDSTRSAVANLLKEVG